MPPQKAKRMKAPRFTRSTVDLIGIDRHRIQIAETGIAGLEPAYIGNQGIEATMKSALHLTLLRIC